MTECVHSNLTYLRQSSEARSRCKHCHLTITTAELGGRHCPECYEGAGVKRSDFEPVAPVTTSPQRLRCEDCAEVFEIDP